MSRAPAQPPITRDELAAWLLLTQTPGVSARTARRLLAAYGLPQAVLAQSASALAPLLSATQIRALREPGPAMADQLDRTWCWLHEGGMDGAVHRIVTLGDPGYPASLLTLDDPPLLLYLDGQAADDPLAAPSLRPLAIVGSRNPTPQGTVNARQFARAFSAAGLTVVSGLALGVDGAAHEGALEGAAPGHLATVAFVGTGLDQVYPAHHRDLARRIAARGLLVSEFPLGAPPRAAHFPQRNRLIAGLSLGTLVVEATLRSGSLITARLAADQGREVFAIPGSIHAAQSRGCHALIRQGAKLVESAQDVLEELPQPATAPRTVPELPQKDSPPDTPDAPLLAQMGHDPVSFDALQARTGLDTATLQAQLLTLELEGAVGRLPGGRFQRIGRA